MCGEQVFFGGLSTGNKFMHTDVVIIGGGVIGLTTAYLLRQQGVSVTLVERNKIGQEASWAGAGMLPSFLPDPELKPIKQLFAQAQHSWPEFSRELLELTGVDNEYQQCGAITLFSETASDQHPINLSTARIRFPWLNTSLPEIYHHKTYAQVRNPRHLLALKNGCLLKGVNIQEECQIQHASFDHDKFNHSNVMHLETSHGRIRGGQYVVTAGAWTAEFLKPWGYQLDIKPIRGQILLYHWENSPVNLVLDAGKKYIVPRKDGHLLIGSTEEDVGFIKENTATGIEELQLFAEELIPHLKTLRPVNAWSGLRPQLSGKIPLVGKLPHHQNLWIAAGHYRWGLQLSYETAKFIAQEMNSPEKCSL